jgi:hypothetical protein
MFAPSSTVRRGLALAVVVLSCPTAALAQGERKTVVPLTNAHAHNDYEHPRPLLDALERGFCSVEADVFLVDGKLLVGHTRFQLSPERTLEALYLDPLAQRAKANGGRIFADGPPFFLLIDVKSDAKTTWAALAVVLARYDGLLSVTSDGKFERKAVTVVISGNCDREAIAAARVRHAGIDGRPTDLDSTAAADLLPWVSERWSALFRWRGEGPIPEEERARLRDFVARAHRRGRLVRFWATPENPVVWKELRSAGVDLINTDRLEDLKKFLLEERAGREGR